MAHGKSSMPSYKVVLIGEYGVGKSSIFRRFLNNSFNPSSDPQSSIGLDFFTKPVTVNGTDVELTLWDTGGMERVSTVTASYYKGSNVALLCFAFDNRDTFNALSQHILDIVMYSKTAKIFLCGTKSDQRNQDGVQDSDISDFQEQCQNVISGFYKVSSRSGDGIDKMFHDIARVMLEAGVRHRTESSVTFGSNPDGTTDNKCSC